MTVLLWEEVVLNIPIQSCLYLVTLATQKVREWKETTGAETVALYFSKLTWGASVQMIADLMGCSSHVLFCLAV